MVPLVGGAILAWLPAFGFEPISSTFERGYIYAYLVFAMAQYFVWAIRVIDRICEVLDINCLTIKKKEKKADEKVSALGPASYSNGDVQKTKNL